MHRQERPGLDPVRPFPDCNVVLAGRPVLFPMRAPRLPELMEPSAAGQGLDGYSWSVFSQGMVRRFSRRAPK